MPSCHKTRKFWLISHGGGGGRPAGLHVSRNTVAKVAAATKRLLSPLVWEMLSKVEFHQQIFPTSTAKSVPIIPDFNYIH